MHGSNGPARPAAIVPHGLLSKYMVNMPPLFKSNNNPIRELAGISGAGSKVKTQPQSAGAPPAATAASLRAFDSASTRSRWIFLGVCSTCA